MADAPLGEFGLIRWIRARATSHASAVLGIGDDAAVLRFEPDRDLVVTTDMLLDGRHFRLAECGPEAAGYKSLAANLSDIAAMAAEPVAAFIAVALPRSSATPIAQGLMVGMAPLASAFGVALAGGDTNGWDGPLVVSITVIGQTVPPGPVSRSGAKPGDAILVTGPLGGSSLGRHLHPRPRVSEALALHRSSTVHAMIDLSDGLASDLGHILAESGGIGASIEADSVPIHSDAERLARQDGRSPLDHALGDGEDFELCLTIASADADRLLAHPPPGVSLYRVGRIEQESGLRLRRPDGSTATLEATGFDHLLETDGKGPDDAG